jgi:hypothetical protein
MLFHNMSSSATTGNPSAVYTQYFTENAGLQLPMKVSAFPSSSHSDSGEGCFSRLNYSSLALRPVALLALLSELTRFASSHRRRLLPGFRRFGHPLRRRISLQCQLGNLHWRDFHPRDHRLASLHHRDTTIPLLRVQKLPGPSHLRFVENSVSANVAATEKRGRAICGVRSLFVVHRALFARNNPAQFACIGGRVE